MSERAEVLATVRRTVRGLVEGSPAALELPAEQRRNLARAMVDVSMLAADLVAEDRRLTEHVARPAAPLVEAQEAGPAATDIGAQAAGSLGQTVRAAKESIDFPTYVQSLITGVFQAILGSTTQQLSSMGEMLDAVSASGEEFESAIPDAEVVRWTLGRLPFVRLSDGVLSVPEDFEFVAQGTLMRQALGASEDEIAGIDGEDLDGTLLPLARRKMARDKQSMLATMVQMGLQRIVVDEGRLSASMDLRVDTRAATQRETYDQTDWRLNAHVGASYNALAWGANADVSTSVGQVHTDHQQSSAQVGAAAGLRSSVELAFRTEQVPLDRMADEHQRVRIQQNARVPQADVSQSSTLGEHPFQSFSTTTPPTTGRADEAAARSQAGSAAERRPPAAGGAGAGGAGGATGGATGGAGGATGGAGGAAGGGAGGGGAGGGGAGGAGDGGAGGAGGGGAGGAGGSTTTGGAATGRNGTSTTGGGATTTGGATTGRNGTSTSTSTGGDAFRSTGATPTTNGAAATARPRT